MVSSGNNGLGEGTIAIPGNSRKVITVGAVKTEKAEKGSCSGAGPYERMCSETGRNSTGIPDHFLQQSDTRKERCVYGKKWKFHGDPGRVRCCRFIDGKISEDYQCRGEIKTQGDVHTFTRSRRTGVGNVEYPRFSETLEA